MTRPFFKSVDRVIGHVGSFLRYADATVGLYKQEFYWEENRKWQANRQQCCAPPRARPKKQLNQRTSTLN